MRGAAHLRRRRAAYPASTVYALKINGKDVPVVDFDDKYDYAPFSADGRSDVVVTRLDGKPIQQHAISPLKLNIAGNVSGSILSFRVAQPQYLIVDVPDVRKLVIAIDPAEIEKPASSGSGIFNVNSNGGDVQAAVNEAGKSGGVVYVSAGEYELPELQIPSNVSLYLESGAVLRCSGNKDDFKIRYHKRSQNRSGTWFIHTAPGASNVKIFGRGTIDANGKHLVKTFNISNHALVPVDCTNFVVDGVTIRDSGLWGTVIANSKNVTFRNTKHFNHLDMGEDDAIDICNSQSVRIERSIAISLDDPYSFKTWQPQTDLTKQWTGAFMTNHDIVLDDCIAWTRCFAFKVGAGVWTDQENITVKNSVAFDSAHAIGISDSYGSADIRNITFENIDIEHTLMNNLGRSWARFVIDAGKRDGGVGGNVHDVRLRNITVRDPGTDPIPVEGLAADKRIDGLSFENIHMPGKTEPASTLQEIGVGDMKFAEHVTVHHD